MKVRLYFDDGQALDIDKCSFLEISTSEKKAVVHCSAEKQEYRNVNAFEEVR